LPYWVDSLGPAKVPERPAGAVLGGAFGVLAAGVLLGGAVAGVVAGVVAGLLFAGAGAGGDALCVGFLTVVAGDATGELPFDEVVGGALADSPVGVLDALASATPATCVL
jgi:hypothetical protein